MSKWLCSGCVWGKTGRARIACPHCCGYNTLEGVKGKWRTRNNSRALQLRAAA